MSVGQRDVLRRGETVKRLHLDWELQSMSPAIDGEYILYADLVEAMKRIAGEGEYCALSWSGHNIKGDRDSVDAVKSAIHQAGTVPELKDEIAELRKRIAGAPVAHGLIRALDYAEGRLMTIDAMKLDSVARNDDVLAVIRDARAILTQAAPRADHAGDSAEMVASEETVRFCPECGLLGDVPAGYQACCPDASHARIVPKKFAEICRQTFRLLVDKVDANPIGNLADPSASSQQDPDYWQWRKKGQPWSLERTFVSRVHATTDDSEVRPLYAAPAPASPEKD